MAKKKTRDADAAPRGRHGLSFVGRAKAVALAARHPSFVAPLTERAVFASPGSRPGSGDPRMTHASEMIDPDAYTLSRDIAARSLKPDGGASASLALSSPLPSQWSPVEMLMLFDKRRRRPITPAARLDDNDNDAFSPRTASVTPFEIWNEMEQPEPSSPRQRDWEDDTGRERQVQAPRDVLTTALDAALQPTARRPRGDRAQRALSLETPLQGALATQRGWSPSPPTEHLPVGFSSAGAEAVIAGGEGDSSPLTSPSLNHLAVVAPFTSLAATTRLVGAVQRSADPGAAAPAPGSQERALDDAASSTGMPLDAAARTLLEHMLGVDVSAVQVHTDSPAASAASALSARAFTVGDSVFFAAGAYQPDDAAGLSLIGHEVVHTVQQRTVVNPSPPTGAMREARTGTVVQRAPAALVEAPATLDNGSGEASSVLDPYGEPEAEEVERHVRESLGAAMDGGQSTTALADAILARQATPLVAGAPASGAGATIDADRPDRTGDSDAPTAPAASDGVRQPPFTLASSVPYAALTPLPGRSATPDSTAASTDLPLETADVPTVAVAPLDRQDVGVTPGREDSTTPSENTVDDVIPSENTVDDATPPLAPGVTDPAEATLGQGASARAMQEGAVADSTLSGPDASTTGAPGSGANENIGRQIDAADERRGQSLGVAEQSAPQPFAAMNQGADQPITAMAPADAAAFSGSAASNETELAAASMVSPRLARTSDPSDGGEAPLSSSTVDDSQPLGATNVTALSYPMPAADAPTAKSPASMTASTPPILRASALSLLGQLVPPTSAAAGMGTIAPTSDALAAEPNSEGILANDQGSTSAPSTEPRSTESPAAVLAYDVSERPAGAGAATAPLDAERAPADAAATHGGFDQSTSLIARQDPLAMLSDGTRNPLAMLGGGVGGELLGLQARGETAAGTTDQNASGAVPSAAGPAGRPLVRANAPLGLAFPRNSTGSPTATSITSNGDPGDASSSSSSGAPFEGVSPLWSATSLVAAVDDAPEPFGAADAPEPFGAAMGAPIARAGAVTADAPPPGESEDGLAQPQTSLTSKERFAASTVATAAPASSHADDGARADFEDGTQSSDDGLSLPTSSSPDDTAPPVYVSPLSSDGGSAPNTSSGARPGGRQNQGDDADGSSLSPALSSPLLTSPGRESGAAPSPSLFSPMVTSSQAFTAAALDQGRERAARTVSVPAVAQALSATQTPAEGSGSADDTAGMGGVNPAVGSDAQGQGGSRASFAPLAQSTALVGPLDLAQSLRRRGQDDENETGSLDGAVVPADPGASHVQRLSGAFGALAPSSHQETSTTQTVEPYYSDYALAGADAAIGQAGSDPAAGGRAELTNQGAAPAAVEHSNGHSGVGTVTLDPTALEDIIDAVLTRMKRQLALDHERAGGFQSELMR